MESVRLSVFLKHLFEKIQAHGALGRDLPDDPNRTTAAQVAASSSFCCALASKPMTIVNSLPRIQIPESNNGVR